MKPKTAIAALAFAHYGVDGSNDLKVSEGSDRNFFKAIGADRGWIDVGGGRRMERKGMMTMMMRDAGSQLGRKKNRAGVAGGLRASVDPELPNFMHSEENQDQQTPLVQDHEVIDGTWLLYSLEFEETIHTVGGSNYNGQVHGLFCKIDLSAQKEDPSKVPFFVNFVREGRCGKAGNHVSLDLYDIVQKARTFDLENANNPLNTIKSIEPTAFLYHEGRCGSTLVSNSVTALAPERTRTLSEPMPLLQALLDCDKTRVNCNVDKAANVFHDVVYMMGRTSNPVEDRMFFKLLPSSVLGVHIVKKAFPDVPWAFIYRNPLHVMVSNLRQKHLDNAPGPYCTGLQKDKHQSEYIQDLVLSSPGNKTLEDLTREEYCAAYLATLTSAAAEEIAFTGGGMGVNYEDMPGVLLDTLFPKHFGLPVGEQEKEHVLAQFGVYSKRMKRNDPKEAKDDSAEKEEEASIEVRVAVNLFLSDSYRNLQLLKGQESVKAFQRKLTKDQDALDIKSSSAIMPYNPMMAPKHHRRLGDPCRDVQSSTLCCPNGSTRQMDVESTSKVTPTFSSTYVTCTFSYTPCPFDATATVKCLFLTPAGMACAGGLTATAFTFSEFDASDFRSVLTSFCPAPTTTTTTTTTTLTTTSTSTTTSAITSTTDPTTTTTSCIESPGGKGKGRMMKKAKKSLSVDSPVLCSNSRTKSPGKGKMMMRGKGKKD